MTLIKDEAFEQLVWLHPKMKGELNWRVYVGEDTLVLATPHQRHALQVQQQLIDALKRSLKFQIMEIAKQNCSRCQKGDQVRRYRSRYGVRLMHYDKRIGWQVCDAERLWQALVADTVSEPPNDELLAA